MNKQECDILEALHAEPYINQRVLSDLSGHSLGIVNRSLRQLLKEGYIDDNIRLTKKAENEFADKAPKQAIILAAGFGMRMVPINLESSKAFLQVNGEYLIERLIRQLHEVGIKKIYVVVGFMKEQFEYLIDEFGVELVINTEYAGTTYAFARWSDTNFIECRLFFPAYSVLITSSTPNSSIKYSNCSFIKPTTT